MILMPRYTHKQCKFECLLNSVSSTTSEEQQTNVPEIMHLIVHSTSFLQMPSKMESKSKRKSFHKLPGLRRACPGKRSLVVDQTDLVVELVLHVAAAREIKLN